MLSNSAYLKFQMKTLRMVYPLTFIHQQITFSPKCLYQKDERAQTRETTGRQVVTVWYPLSSLLCSGLCIVQNLGLKLLFVWNKKCCYINTVVQLADALRYKSEGREFDS